MSTAIKFSERISGKWKHNELSYRHINCEIWGWEEVELLECVKHGKMTGLYVEESKTTWQGHMGLRASAQPWQTVQVSEKMITGKAGGLSRRPQWHDWSTENGKTWNLKLGELPAEIVWVRLWYCSAMTIDAITSETDMVTEAEPPQTCVFF